MDSFAPGQVFGSFVHADVLRQVWTTCVGGTDFRIRHGRSPEQHNQKRIRSDKSVHVFRRTGVQPDQNSVRTHVQTVPGGAVQPQSKLDKT